MNNIICGDCAKVMVGFPADYIDLTVTSPPYDLVDENMITHSNKGLCKYEGYTWDFVAVAQQLWRITKPGGVAVWVVGDATRDGSETGSSFRQALRFIELGFKLNDTMIYKRPAQFPEESGLRYYQAFEYMFILSKGKPTTTNLLRDRKNIHAGRRITGTERKKDGSLRQASGVKAGRKNRTYGTRYNIWSYATGKGGTGDNLSHLGPASFPEALARDHIISWSNPGDLVLDPFVGSGTVPKMCIETGRNYIGIDISPKYCQLSQRRVAGARIPLSGMIEIGIKEEQLGLI